MKTLFQTGILLSLLVIGCRQHPAIKQEPGSILLKNYRPVSIYNIPKTHIGKARFMVIDMHSHPYAGSPEEIAQWVENMDRAGIEKTIILSKVYGTQFDSVYALYAKYPGRFDIWCGLDLSGFGSGELAEKAIAELERCAKVGAKGVGEISDKGSGLNKQSDPAKRLYLDDPRLASIFEKCAELNLPVNVHVADPIWMYQPMDSTNDGMMNALDWRLDNKPDYRSHTEMISALENIVKAHPKTVFIACHFANLSYDLNRLDKLLHQYPNLFADIAARYAETAPIPRFVKSFYMKNQDKLLYGTDMGFKPEMYAVTFRILESADEHFYETEQFGYHWSLNGLDLPAVVLKKVYYENAVRIFDGIGL